MKLCRSKAFDGLLPPGRFIMSADALTVGCKRNVKPEMAELKGKRLIIARLVERIEINHDYEVEIKFRISVEQYMRIAA